ncbi:Lrp/AsnC ligand binding domain-containing protein [Pseudarthrobacter sp. fls2-241-R2A-168]|uniref:Lrp/AsnC family transcriptional regulator n=1 Tax=Pseudarthrobacter sp. fls2-241-R2A-168 TaxID=3040304 RepID=UPI002557426E|nr:Lrp/AsnC ligand binding domain-containing protein [Pseudarthrobacter sp. fls2-241-R2A-168]
MLAQRNDAYTVTAFPTTNHVEALLLPAEHSAVDVIAEEELPRMGDVRSSEITLITQTYRVGSEWHGGALPPALVARLREDISRDDGNESNSIELTAIDRSIAAALESDGRATVRQVALSADVTSQFVGRRMRLLFQSGLLQMRTEVSSDLSGLRLEAHIRLAVEASRVEAVGRHLAADPAVMYCVATTGRYPLEFIVRLPHLDCLQPWLNRTFTDLPGVYVTESLTEPRLIRRANILFDNELSGKT